MSDKDTTMQREGVHRVSESTVRCCEEGETDCPCTCHGARPRDTTVNGLIKHLKSLVETNPEWGAYPVVLEDEYGRYTGWNGKSYALPDSQLLELECYP